MTIDTPLPAGFHHLTLGSGVRAAALRNPKKTAIRCEERSLRYCDLTGRMAKIGAFASQGRGLAVGSRAAILAPNCLEYLEICLGLGDIGVAVATLNHRLSPKEIADILEDCTPALVFVHPSVEDAAREATSLLGEGAPELVIIGDQYEAYLSSASDRIVFPHFPEWTTFSIPYTSGTTGRPKGVLLPHRSRALAAFGMAAEFGCYGPDDEFLAIAPLAHGAGMAYSLASVFFGGTCTIAPTFEADLALTALTKGGHTGVFMVPTHFHKMFALPERDLERLRGSGRLKALMCNAAPLPQSTKIQIVEYFGEGLLHEMYGSTETGVVTNLRPDYQLQKDSCVGTPFACTEVELRSESGGPVADGEPGELFSRSPYLFNGYHERPEATAETLGADGWASVGDIAVRDDEGFYYIVDRKKDMVISGGLNVYPREVERIIDALEGVLESAVVGMPDPEWGERLTAFVVRQPAATLQETAVIASCREALASYKTPRSVYFVDELPRNANGKVMKKDLRLSVIS